MTPAPETGSGLVRSGHPAPAPRSALRRVLRAIGVTLYFAVVLVLLISVLVRPLLDRIYYQGPVSGHYDGARFFNPDGGEEMGLPMGKRIAMIGGLLTGKGRVGWPASVPVAQATPPLMAPCRKPKGAITENWGRCAGLPAIDPQKMVVTWVGHSTMLIQTQGLAILTDPIWSDVAGLWGIGPRRVTRPGIAIDQLPRIDLILVSHNHYDHMDVATLKTLWDRDRPLIVTPLGNDTILRENGIEATALDWGQRASLRPGIDVIATRAHHWGSRWGRDRNRALWSGFVVTLPGGNLFHAGDTGFGDGQWPAEAARHGPIRLALLPIGAFRFRPGQMAISSHMGPIQAVEAHVRLGASQSLAMHWGTFHLSGEEYYTPPRLLRAVMACRQASGFTAIPIGHPVVIPAYRKPAPPGRPMAACPDDDPAFLGYR